MSVISLKNVSRVYGFGESTTVALEDVSLTINRGEFVAIMGPSGSGKSTLMNLIGMLDSPTHGDYKLDSRIVSRASKRKRAQLRRDKVGFIFQSFNLLPRLNALENVALPLTYKGVTQVKRHERAAQMLENVDLESRQYYMPNQLSGGQIQRVAVARALVNRPSIVLADEPTGNLDTASSIRIMELLKEIHEAGNTIIMVTHNPELAQYAERFILLRDGKVEDDIDDFKTMLNKLLRSDRAARVEAVKEVRSERKEQLATIEEKEEKPAKRSQQSKKKRSKKKRAKK